MIHKLILSFDYSQARLKVTKNIFEPPMESLDPFWSSLQTFSITSNFMTAGLNDYLY